MLCHLSILDRFHELFDLLFEDVKKQGLKGFDSVIQCFGRHDIIEKYSFQIENTIRSLLKKEDQTINLHAACILKTQKSELIDDILSHALADFCSKKGSDLRSLIESIDVGEKAVLGGIKGLIPRQPLVDAIEDEVIRE